MRVLVDLPERHISALDEFGVRSGQSRAALVRQAVSDFLARHRRDGEGDCFGLWGSQGADGLVFQEQIRREW